MKKDVEIIVVGDSGCGSTDALVNKLAEAGKTAIIVVENEKQQTPFEPEPTPFHIIPSFDEPLIIHDISNKKWYEHYGKFKKGKNKFGRKK
jgi:hypothetical protein